MEVKRKAALTALFGVALGLTGCASNQARYVYQDHESGVIAIPRNTPKMMAYAEVLMEKHFPGKNYDIVRTVEVETGGSRATYRSDTTSAESKPHSSVLSAFKLSHDRDRKEAESTKLFESRIVYQKHSASGQPGLAFAPSPEFTPVVYTDSVAEELLGTPKKTTQLAGTHAVHRKDSTVVPAAGPIKPMSPPELGGK